MRTGCWLAPVALLLATTVSGTLRCDCSDGELTDSRFSITCHRNRKAGGEVVCENEKRGAVLEGYEAYKSSSDAKYRSLHRVYRTGRDWKGANAACKRDGGHLAVFDDQAELIYLGNFLRKHSHSRTSAGALGVRRYGESSEYKPITGKHLGSLVFINWGAGEPHDAPDRQCMVIRLSSSVPYFLSNHNCDEPEAFICERPLSPPVLASYSFVPGVGFYKTSPNSLPYGKTILECVKNGGHVVIPDTQREAEELVRMFDTLPDVKQIYVGIDDRSGTGEFKTVLGEQMSSLEFQNWAPDALYTRTPEAHCVVMTSKGFYQLVDCNTELPTVCEWRLR